MYGGCWRGVLRYHKVIAIIDLGVLQLHGTELKERQPFVMGIHYTYCMAQRLRLQTYQRCLLTFCIGYVYLAGSLIAQRLRASILILVILFPDIWISRPLNEGNGSFEPHWWCPVVKLRSGADRNRGRRRGAAHAKALLGKHLMGLTCRLWRTVFGFHEGLSSWSKLAALLYKYSLGSAGGGGDGRRKHSKRVTSRCSSRSAAAEDILRM